VTNLKEREIRRIFLYEDTEQIRLMQADEKIFREHYPEHSRWLNMALQDVVQGKRVAFGAYRSGIDEQRRLSFELVGSIILKPNYFTKIIKLKNLFIHQDVRNNGYGKALYHKAEDYCSKAGFVCIETEVPSSEQGTISFLHKMGFKISDSYESPYKSDDYIYRVSKPLSPLYTGDVFDFISFSKWLLTTVLGFTNLRSAVQPYTYTFELPSRVSSSRSEQEVKLGLHGLAFVKDGPAVNADLEDIFGTSKAELTVCLCRKFDFSAKETCDRLRIKTFDDSDLQNNFQHFFAHKLLNFSREQLGGFVLNINPRIFARVRQGLQNFTIFKNGTIGRFLAREQSILLVSEPSSDSPLGCVGGVGIIEEAIVDSPSVVWKRFVSDHPLFDKPEFDSYAQDIDGVLAIRVSRFRLIPPIDYHVLLRDIIQENVDIAEIGCCYLSQDMVRRFEQMLEPLAGKHSMEYDFTLSFAGEDRAYADALAKILNMRGARVFYDKYEEADLLGKDLYQHLQFIYRDSAKFCVIFLSKDYERKLWTQHELKQAQARAFLQQEEYILPIKIDDTEIPGINSTVGYVDLRSKTVEEIADLLMAKLKNMVS